MIETIKKDRLSQLALLLFLFLSVWWIVLSLSGAKETMYNYIFGASYGIMALLGGVWGIKVSYHWGFTKSVIGRAILMLSLGLLAEEFGQLVFSYYNIFLHQLVPYPSLADVGFFGNIPFYTLGIMFLAKASGAQFSLKQLRGKIQIVLLPIVVLAASYFMFLQNYEFDFSQSMKIFLDFGYPLGQALYISIALVTYILSKKLLGGVMKNKILFLIIAFAAQYVADYNFLYQSSRGTWLNGGYGDYMYLFAYFLMTLGLLQLKTVFDTLRRT